MSNRIQKDAESLREKLHGTTPEQVQAQQTSALIILKEPLEKFVREGPKIASKIETASKRISDSTAFHLSEQSKDALRKTGEEGADIMAKAFMEKLRKEAEAIARNDRRVSIPDLGFYIFLALFVCLSCFTTYVLISNITSWHISAINLVGIVMAVLVVASIAIIFALRRYRWL